MCVRTLFVPIAASGLPGPGHLVNISKWVRNVGKLDSLILEQDGFEGLGAGILGSITVVCVVGVVRQVRMSGCRDPWFDHIRVLGVVRHLPVLRLRPHQAIQADHSTQVLVPRRAASVAPRRLVRPPGHRDHAWAEGQWHRPWPGSLQWPRPWRRRERHPRQRRVVHQRPVGVRLPHARAVPPRPARAKAHGAWATTTSAAPGCICGRRRRIMATSSPCAAAAMCPIACLGLGPRMWLLSLTGSSQRVARPARWLKVGFPFPRIDGRQGSTIRCASLALSPPAHGLRSAPQLAVDRSL